MPQTKGRSWYEACTQTIVAFCLSVYIQPPLYALWGWYITYYHSMELALVFTVISLIRGYIVRRVFNYYDH